MRGDTSCSPMLLPRSTNNDADMIPAPNILPTTGHCPGTASGNRTAGSYMSLGAHQEGIAAITLTNLPPELLSIIMHKLDASTDILMLSLTCQQLWVIFQTSVNVYEHLYHILQHNKVMLAQHQQSHGQLIRQTAIPSHGTPEWEKLKNQPIEIKADKAIYQAELLKKIYIRAWELLLQPGMHQNHELISRLTDMLLELSPYIANSKQYTNSLPLQLKRSAEYMKLEATFSKDQREQLLGEDMWTRLATELYSMPPPLNRPHLRSQRTSAS